MTENGERERELRALMAGWGVSIHDSPLFDRALTHASLAGEAGRSTRDYEDLEFLGDAVLGLAVSHYLFDAMPDRTPGEYSRMRAGLVNRTTVARVAREMNIAPVIRLGKGEELSGGRERASLIADCLEALIGAVYLDSGWDVAREFVWRAFRGVLENARSADGVWDYKSRLQNYCQSKRIPLPHFSVVRSEGPDHRKEFEVEVYLQDQPMGRGRGLTKKEAEQNAARQALERSGQHFE